MLSPLRSVWMLAFGLALFCTAAQADTVRCRADSCGERAERDASSLLLQPSERARGRADDALRSGGDAFPPGLFARDELPPGLRDRDELPPGLRDRDELPPGLRDRDELPPGLRDRDELPPGLRAMDEFRLAAGDDIDGPAREWLGEVGISVAPESLAVGASPIPEPTGLLLFSAGLLIAGSAARRQRRDPVARPDGTPHRLAVIEP